MYDPAAGYPAVVVELAYRDIEGALAWLNRVFGLKTLLWQSTQGEIHHAEVQTELGGVVMLRRASSSASASCVDTCKQLVVWVSDVDTHYARVAACAADIVQAPVTKPYGLRQYLVRDFEGHLWEFTQHIRDVLPESWGAVMAPNC